MTLVCVWAAENRLMAIADTRIISSPGNILTEHGPKLLPITVICKQPSESGFINREVYRATVGFAYSGSTLSALAAHALSNTLLSMLAANTGTQVPSMQDIANFVGSASIEYIREVGQLAGIGALFSAIVFGWCPQLNRLRVFKCSPTSGNSRLQMNVEEKRLNNVRVGGSALESAVIIGSSTDLLRQAIDNELQEAQQRGDLPIVAFDAPKRALRKLIAENADNSVGGSIQQAQATALGFQILSNLEPVTQITPSPRNAGLFVLGFDIFDLQMVGNYRVIAEGR